MPQTKHDVGVQCHYKLLEDQLGVMFSVMCYEEGVSGGSDVFYKWVMCYENGVVRYYKLVEDAHGGG
jgi:hypothetical protein